MRDIEKNTFFFVSDFLATSVSLVHNTHLDIAAPQKPKAADVIQHPRPEKAATTQQTYISICINRVFAYTFD